MFEPRFDRHVWIYRENPNGVFTPLNPAVSCANHRVTTAHVLALTALVGRTTQQRTIAPGCPAH